MSEADAGPDGNDNSETNKAQHNVRLKTRRIATFFYWLSTTTGAVTSRSEVPLLQSTPIRPYQTENLPFVA